MKLKMDGICKSFGSNEVLKSVGFQLSEGEICALLGENGAGKSTLMNILGGVLQPDSGEILLDGQKRKFDSPAQSLDAGIAFIHQELNLINDLPIYENMFIGRELKKKNGLLDHKRMIEETRRVFERMGLTLDPKEMVRNLDASYKQIVEISRALLMNAKMIIMDEPTTSLTDPEIEKVFAILRQLREQKVGIVFISHKLREVMEICDSYTVLRDGVMVASGSVKDVTTSDLARFMVGHDVRTEKLGTGAQRGEERLSLHGVTQEPYFRNVDLTAYAGEVLGVRVCSETAEASCFPRFSARKPSVRGKSGSAETPCASRPPGRPSSLASRMCRATARRTASSRICRSLKTERSFHGAS